MELLRRSALILSFCLPLSSFGWGEAGHHMVARLAAKLAAKHPDLKGLKEVETHRALEQFLKVLNEKRYQQGHVANIPDVHWRNLDDGLTAVGNQLGSPTHYLNSEWLAPEGSKDPFAESKFALDYESTKVALGAMNANTSLFKTVGTSPWRAQQFANLMRASLEATPKAACETLDAREDHPTRSALAFGGLLAHFTGDAAMPLHASRDFDGVATGQKGIHWYFENELVDALEPGLEAKVEEAAEKVFLGPKHQKGSLAELLKKTADRFPDLKKEDRVTALVFMELADSYNSIKRMRELDLKYAVSTSGEAINLESCRATISSLMEEMEKTPSKIKRRELMLRKAIGTKEPEQAPCRRLPKTLVDWAGAPCKEPGQGCRPVAKWHESLIIERLALGTAVTAEVWVRAWLDAGTPYVCSTFKYAMKPSFVSPTDGACFGYAKSEKPDAILASAKPPLPSIWKTNSRHPAECVRF